MPKNKAQAPSTQTVRFPSILPIDVLLVTNLLVTGLWAVLFYYPRFLVLHSSGTAPEFLFYAAVTLAVTLLVWKRVRHLDLGWKTLAPVQLLLVMHLLGGATAPNGIRLYDHPLFFGVTYDKVVHAVAGFTAALVVATVMSRTLADRTPFADAQRVLIVMGLCALWELVEYAAYELIPLTGVGLYDNNMQDLLANLMGATLFIAQPRRWRELEMAHDRKEVPAPIGTSRAERKA